MTTFITKLVPLISFALLFWAGTFALSSAVMPEPETPERRGEPINIDSLRSDLSNSPESVSARLKLASGLRTEADNRGDPKLLMEALEHYVEVLRVEPNNLSALSDMGDVAFSMGVLDKAMAYYQRYLDIKPDDIPVQTDLALAVLQTGDTKGAIAKLEQIVQKNEKLFPPRLSLALALRMSGDKERAKIEAARAFDIAPDDTARQVVKNFVAELDGAAPAVEDRGLLSPAAVIENYFRSHSIVGPKIERITWPSADKARIEVKEFPVDQMPQVAKDKFIGNVKAKTKDLQPPITVEIVDAGSGAVLLTIVP